ncbi:SCP2 sterol-binding domain-containing protein [Kineothrix sp. MB12-C1]|uniref:SCP2 sterol-binding domain-containing protein n=1 Tax=Kineothrix sp. MB12-C1 TaxID=3070215 RepID=UPI0027D2B75A|nr:SCP2 sterol-binding domain-containing protein [Kineothrix sp. MB12-C1]WMC94338.1 SCP2 sterol-binding domain-containing protein [Kineothrix sp. MB12-C1]
MKINIYYGGRGLIDDPTLFVINRMQQVLEELRVNVERYHLLELKNSITTLPQTLKEADGIILATTVEWYGIGGFMQQFLDSCWLYGDKEKISNIYMCPIVMSTTYGEREGKLSLSSAWEILGGRPCSGMCGYVADTSLLEVNQEYIAIIEKKAENMYRTVNQKTVSFPASNQTIRQMTSKVQMDLTPQETEQLSQYASDDRYVQRQKEDIQELTNLFRNLIDNSDSEENEGILERFQQNFRPQPGFKAAYRIVIEGRKKQLIIKVENADLQCYYGTSDYADVELQLNAQILDDIIYARMTFQRAFMSGVMKLKGDFKVLRTLDHLFVF